MVRSVAGDPPEQVKNNQSINMAVGNGGQKMSQYSWFTVYLNITIQSYKTKICKSHLQILYQLPLLDSNQRHCG